MHIKLPILGKNTDSIVVSEAVFGRAYSEALIHQVITSYLAKARQGTHAQKNRSAVSGGGKKPWRQKGGGRARAGTIRSPIWRKGGVTFASQTQDYSKKVNKKMYRAALCSILSELIRQNRLIIIDLFVVDSPKTKELANKLKNLNLLDVLIISNNIDENLYLASRNLPNIYVSDVAGIDPVSLLNYDKILVTEAAVKQIEVLLQ